jgi:diguanylate cyclase (GGDEF)-like protein
MSSLAQVAEDRRWLAGWWRRPGSLRLLLALTVFAASLYFAYRNIDQSNNLANLRMGQQIHTLLKTYEELNRVNRSLRRYVLNDPTERTTHEVVQLNLDLLASRIRVFHDGEANRPLLQIAQVHQAVEELSVALDEIDALLPGLEADPYDERYARIQSLLTPLQEKFFTLGKQFILSAEVRNEQFLQQYSNTHSIWAIAAPVLSGALLLLMFFLQLRQSTLLTQSLRSQSNKLEQLASHDSLTALPNRALLNDRLRQAIQDAHRAGSRFALMFIDLDGFKPVNDSLGHPIGDQILIEVAQRLIQQIRPADTLARLGGDEFIIILSNLTQPEDAALLAERIIGNISRPYKVGNFELHITASIGITLSDADLPRPEQLIQQADLAMRQAKKQGRNNYQWYTQDLEQKVDERVNLRIQLQKAIENEAFTLHYQPQLDGHSGRVVGFEALLRWQHAELGFIPPLQFIPLAETTGQIVPLSEWVLKTACRDARLLLDQGYKGTLVAVNISPVHFQRSNFVERVRVILEQAQLPPEALELEITETVLLDNPEKAVKTLQGLKQLGVSLAIDDFGTGFSSLNYLKRLPIDKVKIDRSFVQDIISDQHDAAISKGIISMAHHLKLKVIAEGVESESQFVFLQKNHCDEYQGYYFAKPMPLPQLEQFLAARRTQVPTETPSRGQGGHEQTLLLLDDEPNVLRALTRLLRREGYQILTASNAQDAFSLLATHDVQVILSDQRMPEMNGTEFLSRVKALYPDTIRLVLSGYTDLKSVTDAINQGSIYKFLTKPWDDGQLRVTIAQAFQHYRQAAKTATEDTKGGTDHPDRNAPIG